MVQGRTRAGGKQEPIHRNRLVVEVVFKQVKIYWPENSTFIEESTHLISVLDLVPFRSEALQQSRSQAGPKGYLS